MIQPLFDVPPGDRVPIDGEIPASTPARQLPDGDALLAARVGAGRDVSRIASALFCSSTVDPSIVTFAKLRTAQHWGLAVDDVDVQITMRLLVKTARLMADQHILAADRMIGLAPAA